MSAKTAKDEMMQAHEAMAAVLDAKFRTVPEWRAFRAIDRALLALEVAPSSAVRMPPHIANRRRPEGAPPSYTSLADQLIGETGKPVPTNEIMAFIASKRSIGSDRDRAKVTVQSSLSKDKRFKNVAWEGGRAWWYADRPIPKKETAA
jgi:hypothetical protein